MKILDISPGSLSLEFAPYEKAIVMQRLEDFGRITVAHEATFDRIKVAQVELIYLNEWDEPCLISSTPAGARLLKSIVAPGTPAANASLITKGAFSIHTEGTTSASADASNCRTCS